MLSNMDEIALLRIPFLKGLACLRRMRIANNALSHLEHVCSVPSQDEDVLPPMTLLAIGKQRQEEYDRRVSETMSQLKD